MSLYKNLLKDGEYLTIVRKIEGMHFITDGKWDWEHGLGHYQRVAEYTKKYYANWVKTVEPLI